MEVPYMIKLCGRLMPGRYDDLDEAAKNASGMLLSRSADLKAEVVKMAPDCPPIAWPVVATASRKRRGGPVTIEKPSNVSGG